MLMLASPIMSFVSSPHTLSVTLSLRLPLFAGYVCTESLPCALITVYDSMHNLRTLRIQIEMRLSSPLLRILP
jgi:hypothetical protein